MLTPYTADVTTSIAERFADAGLTVTALGSFLESSDLVLARISEQSIAHGIRTIASPRRLRCSVRVMHEPTDPQGR